jgi:hypothetical protein
MTMPPAIVWSVRCRNCLVRILAIIVGILSPDRPVSPANAEALRRIASTDLCVTLGAVAVLPDDRLSVTVAKMRAVARVPTAPAAHLRFTYLGRSKRTSVLGSGEIRAQFGLKLRAQDSCNVVYVMWRFEPESKLVVSIKHNPGMRMHAQCGTAGYRNIVPDLVRELPPMRPGGAHSLHADMQGRALSVRVDGAEIWRGDVGSQALSIDGPVGVRSDNVRVEFALDAAAAATDGRAQYACPKSATQEE